MLQEILPPEIAATRRQVATINHLINLCRDTSMTYRAAADVPSRHHRELMVMSRRRSSFVGTLSTFLRHPPERADRGSFAGRGRRWVFKLRSSLMGQSHMGDSLQTCETAEHKAHDAYKHALAMPWTDEIASSLRLQLAEIDNTSKRVKDMRGQL
jgi:uncharacterized protein (TIGR02284 family)